MFCSVYFYLKPNEKAAGSASYASRRGGEEGTHSSQNLLSICWNNTEIQTPEALTPGSTSALHPSSSLRCYIRGTPVNGYSPPHKKKGISTAHKVRPELRIDTFPPAAGQVLGCCLGRGHEWGQRILQQSPCSTENSDWQQSSPAHSNLRNVSHERISLVPSHLIYKNPSVFYVS